mmetsp:Transcript_2153/g.6413  ORF Transcript_2153/g.6413 Transcript_2153/m.6413 type:complete len:526 (+) Transcript_2153:164-1741(+)
MPAPRRAGRSPTFSTQLASQAPRRKANNLVGVGRYLQSAELLLRQANLYRNLRDDSKLYVFLMRYASLVVETIPEHQEFSQNDARYKKLKQRLIGGLMQELEATKLRLDLPSHELPQHNQYLQPHRPVEAVQTSLTALPGLDWAQYSQQRSAPAWTGYTAQSLPGVTMSSPSSSGQMDLLSSPQGGVQNGTEQNLLPFDPRQLGRTSSSGGGGLLPAASAEALQRHAVLPAISQRRRPQQPQPLQPRPLYPAFDSTPLAPINYQFENVTPSAPPVPGLARPQASAPSLMDSEPAAASQPPPPPPSTQLTEDLRQQQAANVGPRLDMQLGPQEFPVDMVSPTAGDPCCGPTGRTPSPLDKPAGFEGVRDVHVSVSLMEDFMRLCQANTIRNIETIGLLGGTLSADGTSFNINTLIIPKQKGETDRVEMLKEEELWDIFFQDDAAVTQSLFPVGWIHTHPAFDCFLSSVDIHNQYGYQVMLDEAVAIVMSPRDSQNRKCGMFRLTTPGGMDLIKVCSAGLTVLTVCL